MTKLLQINHPIIQAPMAGGITTTELVTAVSKNGGLGSVGAGYMSAEALKEQIKAIQTNGVRSFGVNIFVPSPFSVSDKEIITANERLQPFYKDLKIEAGDLSELPSYEQTLQTYQDQIRIVLDEKVPVVSFTFGLPNEETVSALQNNGTIVMATATTVAEAIEIERIGIDVVIAQGSEAGGHRGNFFGKTEDSLIGLMSLVPQIVDSVNIPVVAAGGIMDGRGICAAFALGAQAVQMGTAFLTTNESGAHPSYKQAVLQAEETETTLTKAFSGKFARGVKNELIEKMSEDTASLLDYPAQNTLTQSIRQEAQRRDNADYMSLWTGQSPRLSRGISVAELMKRLLQELTTSLEDLPSDKF